MYILKNALRNIRRSKMRNLLIGVIVLVIATACCLGLSIRQAAVNAKKTGLENLTVTAQITFDRQSMMQNLGNKEDRLQGLQQMQWLTLDQLQTYAQNENVRDFYYTLSVSMGAGDDISPVETQSSNESGQNNAPSFGNGKGGGKQMMGGMGAQGDFTLSAYNTFDAMTAFQEGTSAVTAGSFFEVDTAENACVISDELATLNELAVGDTITLQNPNDTEETVTFTVCGIYHNDEASVGGGFGQGFSAASDPANTIYVPYTTLKTAVDTSAENAETTTDENTGREMSTAMRGTTNGTYIFADADALTAFEESVDLPDGYAVSSSDVTAFEQSLVPLESLAKFAGWFLLIVLVIGGLILIVFNIFSVRERTHEIGVLTAIGMKKHKVAAQFITEVFVVTFAALLIGTAIGAVVAVPATNALLEAQVTTQQNQSDRFQQNLGFGGNQPPEAPDGGMPDKSNRGGFFENMGGRMTDYVTEVSSATDFTVVLQLLAIGLGLTLLSSLAAVSSIMRYEPLKILSKG
ncbi:MAG: ABC transporter permease [Clostridia bacterium]|nr:ABC transporter permease [Clostridia bacterium]